MNLLQIFLVASLASCLFWRVVDTLYPDPSIGFWWCVPAALLGGILVTAFTVWYRHPPAAKPFVGTHEEWVQAMLRGKDHK